MAKPIVVYSAEAKAGLTEQLQNNKVIATLSPLADKVIPNKLRETLELKTKNHLSATAAEGVDQFDLHKLYTILVTVGWNLNDDVFGVKQVWAARHTPEDKPFNLEHNPRNIIGHITGCVAVNDDYELIDDETNDDDLPAKFHILTSAVLYKHIASKDADLSKETNELIESVVNGDWYVSMEALFSDFDYAITTASGEQKIVERNEETAWLTKHLRVHGGAGEIKGNKIGRYLKDITFSGKGLVKRPGNPESYVFNDVSQFKGAFASLDSIYERNNTMPVENTDVVSKAEYNELQKTIAELRTRLEAAQEAKVKEQVEALNKAIAARDEEITTLKTEVENTKAAKNEAAKALEAAQADVEASKKKLAEAEQKLEETRVATVKANRISTLVDKGVEKADAEKLVDTFVAASDEQFNVIVETQAKLVEAQKAAAEAASKKPDDKSKKKEEEKKEAAKAEEDLKNAKADEEAPLSTSASEEVTPVMAGLADFLGQQLVNTKK